MHSSATSQPAAAPDVRRELTVGGIILGGIITLAFTAANVYLGLKVGLTFATSIPAAVISMAILRALRTGTIQENNIVQTVASAAGTISAVIFALPGLLMVGWWTSFPFWPSFWICMIGGTLGVMFTIPLRRALVTNSDLPYPEGVAAAEVLRVGSESRQGAEESRAGLLAVVWGAIVSAVFALIAATKVFASEVDGFFRAGAVATGGGFGLSFALLGAGHLIGLAVGLAIATGFIISWAFAVPILTALHPVAGDAATVATTVWRTQVRFIGAGTIGVAAIWTLVRLAVPVWTGLMSAIQSSRVRAAGQGETLARTEHDMPVGIVALITLVACIPMAVLYYAFLHASPASGMTTLLLIAGVLYVIIAGFVVAGVAGYMAGLIGASNSPVSGLAILSVLGVSLILVAFAHDASGAVKDAMVAFAIFVTSIVLASATIANDNLQDLKTGQLVDATPWRQQVALLFGVLFGSLVIPPVLNMLAAAYGFAGVAHSDPNKALAAPQATLISALARGVIGHNLDWGMILIGAALGVVFIVIDEALRASSNNVRKLPPLAVGLGIYLPVATTSCVAFGSIVGHFYNRAVDGRANGAALKRLGVLLASGLIVGESLFGVLHAGIIVARFGNDPLAFMPDSFLVPSEVIGAIAFLGIAYAVYRWVGRLLAA